MIDLTSLVSSLGAWQAPYNTYAITVIVGMYIGTWNTANLGPFLAYGLARAVPDNSSSFTLDYAVTTVSSYLNTTPYALP